ncbi:MAG: 30S ribosomal protein S6 [Actinomycetota bacterium]
MREYEIMLILPPEAEEATVSGVVERITGVLSQSGGEVSQVDQWGRRRLAYEIARKTEGYYVIVRFKAEPTTILELERVLSLADEVIRHKVVLRQAA